ncbi:hypothetical protein KAK07_06360 [Ideonella sp. 4Y16]|uniref:hypothetical protein n=1 Tax=Ideonella alba TaxID=2824118 RepID=UPI001B37A32A|nr:hypothetical protein [Ideonella alba]MBQ0942951.1 hypothetical protein [Ideonella alba]
MAASLTPWLAALGLFTAVASHAHDGRPAVQFQHCTEFVGVAPVDASAARAAVPAAYTLVADGAGARLVVRVADCQQVRVGAGPARPGRVAQIGLMVVSPDGTGTDPLTSINNYLLSYATNGAALAVVLRSAGIPVSLDEGLTIETLPQGARQELFAAVAADNARWGLLGQVSTPSLSQPFLANWWYSGRLGRAKMATDIPVIAFDFTSQVRFVSSLGGVMGPLLPGHASPEFPLSFRGAFDLGTMTVSLSR